MFFVCLVISLKLEILIVCVECWGFVGWEWGLFNVVGEWIFLSDVVVELFIDIMVCGWNGL